MSNERETQPEPGAAVEEQAVEATAVQDAVDRAQAIVEEANLGAELTATPGASESAAESAAEAVAAAEAAGAVAVEAAGEAATAEAAATQAQVAADAAAAEYARQEQLASLDTQLDLERPQVETPLITPAELPTAAAAPAETPVRDGEIRISADHPMAALYMQTPMPPDLKGNRGAGILITLLATLGFAVLYAGLIAIMLAPSFPPSTFLSEGLLPWVTSWGFIAGVSAFFVGLSVLVLIFGRAGWWAYVLFSLFVGIAVWTASTAVFALTGDPASTVAEYAKAVGQPVGEWRTTLAISKSIAFGLPTLGAAVLAREVAVWFGAWIGARGRKVTGNNAALLAEYEVALGEVKAQA